MICGDWHTHKQKQGNSPTTLRKHIHHNNLFIRGRHYQRPPALWMLLNARHHSSRSSSEGSCWWHLELQEWNGTKWIQTTFLRRLQQTTYKHTVYLFGQQSMQSLKTISNASWANRANPKCAMWINLLQQPRFWLGSKYTKTQNWPNILLRSLAIYWWTAMYIYIYLNLIVKNSQCATQNSEVTSLPSTKDPRWSYSSTWRALGW